MENVKRIKRTKQFKRNSDLARSAFSHIIFSMVGFILVIFSLIVILMLLWAFITSLKDNYDIIMDHNLIGLPNFKEYGISTLWKSYVDVIKNFGFKATFQYYTITGYHYQREVDVTIFTMALNSLVYAGGGSIVMTLVPAVVAYVLAKYKFKLAKIIYTVALICYIIPIVGNYPSMLNVLSNLGLLDTWLGFFLMKFNFLTMYFFVFHSYFSNLNDSFIEAAELDGANQVQVIFKVVLPLAKSLIFSVLLINFIQLWNDFQFPNLYLQTHPTLAYGIWRMAFINIGGLTDLNQRMASVMTLGIPVLILFIILKDKLMTNVTAGGVKD